MSISDDDDDGGVITAEEGECALHHVVTVAIFHSHSSTHCGWVGEGVRTGGCCDWGKGWVGSDSSGDGHTRTFGNKHMSPE